MTLLQKHTKEIIKQKSNVFNFCDSEFSFCFGNSSLNYNMLRSPKVRNKITRDIFRATHKGSGGHCSGPNPHLTQGLFNASQRMPESHRENTQIPKAIMFGYAFHKQIHLLRF